MPVDFVFHRGLLPQVAVDRFQVVVRQLCQVVPRHDRELAGGVRGRSVLVAMEPLLEIVHRPGDRCRSGIGRDVGAGTTLPLISKRRPPAKRLLMSRRRALARRVALHAQAEVDQVLAIAAGGLTRSGRLTGSSTGCGAPLIITLMNSGNSVRWHRFRTGFKVFR